MADSINPDTPLRLSLAANEAFPGGGMTASGLRREHAAGRLVIERIAGKDYTTLSAIAKMRELCRVEPKRRVSVPARSGEAPGSAIARMEARRERSRDITAAGAGRHSRTK